MQTARTRVVSLDRFYIKKIIDRWNVLKFCKKKKPIFNKISDKPLILDVWNTIVATAIVQGNTKNQQKYVPSFVVSIFVFNV